MGTRFDNLPLAVKLRLMLLGALACVLTLVLIVCMAADIARERRVMSEHLVTLAQVAANTAGAPIKANSRAAALDALWSLRADPDVRSATLFDTGGAVVADMALDGTVMAPAQRLEAWGIRDAVRDPRTVRTRGLSYLHIEVPVMLTGEHLGVIHVDAELSHLVPQVLQTFEMLLVWLLLAGAAGYLVSRPLARRITAPAAALGQLSQNIVAGRKYSLRAEPRSTDELGACGAALNHVLAEVEKRGLQLATFQKDFEVQVQARTAQLGQSLLDAQEVAKRAEGANRAKSDFLARMSHEIRTPMNGVLGMAELLVHSPSLDERQRRYADTIHQSGRTLLQIINDILDFSKIEAGKLQLSMTQFCIREVVEDAVEIIGESAHAKGLELICDIPAQMDTQVYGDGLRVRQVVMNLLSNAVKFTEAGEISVKVRPVGSSLVSSSFFFEVTDTGIGIQPANCVRIFESFAQEDSSTTRRYGGTGLGLAICKQLVELMGGRIGVTSTPGQGSKFFFSLPLATDPADIGAAAPKTLQRTRMLIVDDNSTVRDILRQHLSSWGVTVVEADGGAAALAIVEKSLAAEFDAIIVDQAMPQMNGQELVQAIRRKPDFSDIPIVMLGKGSDEAARDDAEGKTIFWLGKPIRREQLNNCLTRLIEANAFTDQGRVRASQRVAEAQQAAPPPPARVQRVLLVEDNPVNQEVARAMLEKLGIEPVAVWSGEEALQRLAKERFEVIFMDCQMPRLDGYETTRRFRAMEKARQRRPTPIVALTATALDGDAEKCFEAGMDRYLSKPFTLDQLAAVLDSYAPAPAAAVASAAAAAPALAPAPVSAPREPRPGPADNAPVLDARTLEGIRALRRPGGVDFVTRLIGVYTENSTSLMEAMKAAVIATDLAELMRAAHALKSSSAHLGANRLAAVCGQIEAAGLGDNPELAFILVERAIVEHMRALEALGDQTLAA